jgi:hypothetical protein
VHEDVERPLAEVGREALGEPGDREVAHVLVPLAPPQLLGRVGEGVERGVERVDALELKLGAVAQGERGVHLPALDQVEEDVERGRPRPHAHGGAGLGERLGDGEPEPPVIGHAGDERAASESDRC